MGSQRPLAVSAAILVSCATGSESSRFAEHPRSQGTDALATEPDDAPAGLKLQIFDAATGAPADGAAVWLVSADRVVRTGVADSNGACALFGVLPGNYEVHVALRGHLPHDSADVVLRLLSIVHMGIPLVRKDVPNSEVGTTRPEHLGDMCHPRLALRSLPASCSCALWVNHECAAGDFPSLVFPKVR
jgi:hypothetical protein